MREVQKTFQSVQRKIQRLDKCLSLSEMLKSIFLTDAKLAYGEEVGRHANRNFTWYNLFAHWKTIIKIFALVSFFYKLAYISSAL